AAAERSASRRAILNLVPGPALQRGLLLQAAPSCSVADTPSIIVIALTERLQPFDALVVKCDPTMNEQSAGLRKSVHDHIAWDVTSGQTSRDLPQVALHLDKVAVGMNMCIPVRHGGSLGI
ncbi:MAG: hypothetical protein NTZ90_00620, partial [Proteobacteria bacterium]|nr:hypothetical protein [Pseudomonadota bacterium]